MKLQRNPTERGQAIILIAIGIIGLMAFLVLAVDGGSTLYDRRTAQNAVDAAALAGGYAYANNPWSTTVSGISNAVHNRAHDNSYDTIDGKTVSITVSPNPLPSSPEPSTPVDIRVAITSKVTTSFIQLIYSGDVKNTVEATAHVIPPDRGSPFNGSALVSLAPTGCGVTSFNGNVNANLIGGGIYDNSSDPNCALNGPGGSYMVYSPFVDVVGGISSSVGTNNLIVPNPGTNLRTGYQPQLNYPPGIHMPDPPTNVCSGSAASKIASNVTRNDPNGAAIKDAHNHNIKFDQYSPGVISTNIKNLGNAAFDPGVYCLTGGFDLNASQYIWGENVLFYIAGSAPCGFTWNGGAEILLSGVGLKLDGTTQSTTSGYKGMLIYVSYVRGSGIAWSPQSSLSAPSFNGNQASVIIGTVYAPTCNIQLNGTGGNFYQGQMIGYTTSLTGNSTVFMNYNPDKNITIQNNAKVDLAK
jgi:hypothetical protein